MKHTLAALTLISALSAIPATAEARDWHDNHRSHSGVSLSLNFGSPYYHSYYRPVRYVSYAPAYVPPPVYYSNNDYNDSGYCREFTNNVYVGGRMRQSYGTACLQPDGSWRVVQ